MTSATRSGSCNCGKVKLEIRGEPRRVGLCHCLTCRKETGSAFMAFAVWDRNDVTVTGETKSWTATTDHRHFCPHCGSALFGLSDANNEIEVKIGVLDEAPSGLAPSYELWIPRRERWQPAIPGTTQLTGNRPA